MQELVEKLRQEYPDWRIDSLAVVRNSGPEPPTKYWAKRADVFLSALSVERLRSMIEVEERRSFQS